MDWIRKHGTKWLEAGGSGCLLVAIVLGTPPFFTPKTGSLLDSTTLALSASVVLAAGAVAGELICRAKANRRFVGKKPLALVLVALYAVLGYGATTLSCFSPDSRLFDIPPVAGFLLEAAFGVALPCVAAFTSAAAFPKSASEAASTARRGTTAAMCFLAGAMAPLAMASYYPNRCLYVVGSPSAVWGSTVQQLIGALTGAAAPPWAAASAVSPASFGVDCGVVALVPPLFYVGVLCAAQAAGGPLSVVALLIGLLSTWSLSWADPTFIRLTCGHSHWFLAATAVAIAALLAANRFRRHRLRAADELANKEPSQSTVEDFELDVSLLTENEARAITLMLDGHTSAEIASLMERSPSTIRNTQAHAYKKLGVSSAAELRERRASAKQEDTHADGQPQTTETAHVGIPTNTPALLAGLLVLLPTGIQPGATAVPLDYWRSAVLATVCGYALGRAPALVADKNTSRVRGRFVIPIIAILICSARFFALKSSPFLCAAAQLTCAAFLAVETGARRFDKGFLAMHRHLSQHCRLFPWPSSSAWHSKSAGDRPIPGDRCCPILQWR